ncbi:uncharacterized protein LOC144436747 [Glandiceps talaboti]
MTEKERVYTGETDAADIYYPVSPPMTSDYQPGSPPMTSDYQPGSPEHYNEGYNDEEWQQPKTLLQLAGSNSQPVNGTEPTIQVSNDEPVSEQPMTTTEPRWNDQTNQMAINQQPMAGAVVIVEKDERDTEEKTRLTWDWLLCLGISPLFCLPLGIVAGILTLLTHLAINKGDHTRAKMYYAVSKVTISVSLLLGLLIPVIVGVSLYYK